MSTLEAMILGVAIGLGITGARVVWVLWTTRVNGIGDYALAVTLWWADRRRR